jgi:tetratricopeptide (TPR) repeat protein
MISRMIPILLAILMIASTAHADDLRVVKRGQSIPQYSLPTLAGQTMTNAPHGEASIIVYVSAEQTSSERAASEAQEMVRNLRRNDLHLQFVTADTARSTYFRTMRERSGIRAPLGLDFDRSLYGGVGLIVLPTTIVIDREGRLAHVIAGYKPDYPHVLEAYARHALGLIDAEELERQLTTRTFHRDSPANRAARHRAAASLLRERGLRADAERELRTAIEIDPDLFDAHLDLCSLLIAEFRTSVPPGEGPGVRAQQLNEAEGIVTHVLQRDPANRRAKLHRGIVLYHAGQLDEAEAALTEALLLNPDPARTHYYLGLGHEKKGDTARALHHYRQALGRLLDERE